MRETPYGDLERRRFMIGALRRSGARSVLDIGCGTGTLLTAPLSVEFPEINFVGVDDDDASIEYASHRWRHPNIRFERALSQEATFDAVIASEVLEHVEEPAVFLLALRAQLEVGGVLLLTVPNGYGPFEGAAFVQNALYFSGMYGPLRAAWRILRGKAPWERHDVSSPTTEEAMTLAVSPHINFFTSRDVQRLAESNGFRMIGWRSRVVVCGFGFDYMIRWLRLAELNVRVAGKLPRWLTSDWMIRFEAVPVADGSDSVALLRTASYHRRADARWRRTLNERRWGVKRRGPGKNGERGSVSRP